MTETTDQVAQQREKRRRAKARQDALDRDEAPEGCKFVTFICPDCSGVMGLIMDEDGKILKTVRLRERPDGSK